VGGLLYEARTDHLLKKFRIEDVSQVRAHTEYGACRALVGTLTKETP
jgi:hypothetical protein